MPIIVWLAIKGAGRQLLFVAALALLLFVTGSWALANTTLAVHRQGGTWFNARGVDDWKEMRAQYDWIASETRRDSVIAGVHDPTYYLFTGRKALRPFSFKPILLSYNVRGSAENPFGTAADLRHRLLAMKADYLVLTPRDGVERLANELLALVPGSLSPVFGTDPSGHLIYRVNRAVLSNRASQGLN
jgi:hypothetical protein